MNPETDDPVLSANWYCGRLEQIFGKRPVQAVVGKISFGLDSIGDVLNHGAPIGLLAHRAHLAAKPLTLLTKLKLKGHAIYGLPKGTDPYAWVDALKDGKPRWDAATRDATLAAITGLP